MNKLNRRVKTRLCASLVVFLSALTGFASMPAVAQEALTNDDVIHLMEAGFEDSLIIAKIETSDTAFDTSVRALVTLARKGVSNDVVAAMVAAGRAERGEQEEEVEAASAEEPLRVLARRPPGTVFNDELSYGGQGPDMVVLPAGHFQMGCVMDDGKCTAEQMPTHEVEIYTEFAISVYEITFADWDTCYAADGCGGYRPRARWGRGMQPVNYVSWDDAQSYVSWLSNATGEEYRLPSESEWEYAARAGSPQLYSWGGTVGRNRANCRGCGSRFDDDATAPVGTFAANAFGLHDVHGNVWEWVEDCWNEGYARAPNDGSAWLQGDCSKRVLRGGAWSSNALTLRSSYRNNDDQNGRGSGRGFRVARTIR